MSWMTQLLKTYENNINIKRDENISITPVGHMNANVQIEVTLNKRGEFNGAVVINNKENMTTLIPVTELSAGRSSGIAPHALSDTLSYVAGDFYKYCDNKKLKESSKEKFKVYIGNLQEWVESSYSTKKIKCIYKYLIQEKLIEDLEKSGIIQVKEDGTYETKKISGQPYEKTMVRFIVLGDENEETWKDTELIRAYTSYYLSKQDGKKDICYLTGTESMISENHPKGIVSSDYGAKLVSANDTQGYIFRGRFQDSNQAYALSYEASQKVHSALTWLIKTKGIYIGNQDKRAFVCWNPVGKNVPSIDDEFECEDEEMISDVETKYRKQLRRTFDGKYGELKPEDEAIIMGLDAATTGRLSITYYYELMAPDLLNRIINWGETCNWKYLRFNKLGKAEYIIRTPSFGKIIQCAFGRENKEIDETKENFQAPFEVNDKLLKQQTQRLIKCMLEKQIIPYDIVQALTVRASSPLSYSRKNRETLLSTACALIVKYYYDIGVKGEYSNMKLDVENQDRSYLFGRLLAVYESVERSTYNKDEKREPNAIQLQSVYVNHPMQTWKNLEELLIPYFQKLDVSLRIYYKKIIQDIIGTFRDEDTLIMNQSLKETYLLGYYLQRAELYMKKIDKEEVKNEQITK